MEELVCEMCNYRFWIVTWNGIQFYSEVPEVKKKTETQPVPTGQNQASGLGQELQFLIRSDLRDI